jgi:hypothetical protein
MRDPGQVESKMINDSHDYLVQQNTIYLCKKVGGDRVYIYYLTQLSLIFLIDVPTYPV